MQGQKIQVAESPPWSTNNSRIFRYPGGYPATLTMARMFI